MNIWLGTGEIICLSVQIIILYMYKQLKLCKSVDHIKLKMFFVAATLKHVAKTVAHVELSDHVVNVVFTLFDDNSE